MSYLNQVASTRSDIYTAYVLVRAYPVNDFSVAPVDEYRLLAVFDRSEVNGDNPIARDARRRQARRQLSRVPRRSVAS